MNEDEKILYEFKHESRKASLKFIATSDFIDRAVFTLDFNGGYIGLVLHNDEIKKLHDALGQYLEGTTK